MKKRLIYSHTSKYLQVFLYGTSLFNDDSVYFLIFKKIISHYYFYQHKHNSIQQ